MNILINVIVSSLAVLLTARLLPGVTVDTFSTAIAVAVLLGLMNAFLARIPQLLSQPISMLAMGLFTFFAIGLMVLLTARMVPGFRVDGFWWALVFALVLSAINTVFHGLKYL